MKETFLAIGKRAFSITLAIGAIILAVQGKPGWGWFLFCSIL